MVAAKGWCSSSVGDHGTGGSVERGSATQGVLRRQPGSAATATEAQRCIPSLAPAASGAIGGGAAAMVARGHPNRRGTFSSWAFATLYWVAVWSGLYGHPLGWWRVLVADEYANHRCEAVFLLIVLAPIVFISVLKAMLE
uniref:Uncharacterized protein n=1 Tax=Oryza punctata TaxID=4537 RepID=A0A0E0M6B1_ORYPU